MSLSDKKPSHHWQTLWSVLGPELPDKPIWIAKNILIRPRNAAEEKRKQSLTTPNLTVTVSQGFYVVHYPPRDEVQGSHRVQINVDATNEDEAVKAAEQLCDRLTASLSLAVGGTPYSAQLLQFRRADLVQESSNWSQVTRITPLARPAILADEKLQLGLKISRSVENDDTANNAFMHLWTAWQLQATSGSKPLQRSILQHYVLSLEAVVNGAMNVIRKDRGDAIKLSEQKFSKEFSENLPKRADKAKAIREASTKLREISLTNMIPSIETIGPIMGIPESVCADAKELYRYRSRNLSHPGKKQGDGMAKWLGTGPKSHDLCLADIVARAFLLAYCEHTTK
ncbi:hypothetical protein [uncultured Cohaesibacter sp.]|uniref:hypothetical protein n=1 Tax=uncultured Cohaesibacter sp. TaxID=1002546 RepID=UPI002AA814D8|nr:hypothetical protein [uncultured Cohaesibacter sp.]